jgi:aminopeptidase
MLTEKQLDRYADVLLWGLKTARNGRLNKSEYFLVRFGLPALRLAEILQAKLLEMGMNPILRMELTPTMERTFFEAANRKQLVQTIPGDRELYRNLNGSIFLHAPDSITHLGHIDPKKIGQFLLSRKYLRDIFDQREAKGLFSWTLCMVPTAELAKHARIGLKAYTNQVVNACFLNRTAPVDEWRRIYKKAQVIKKWLNQMRVKQFHIESKNIDLIVTPGSKRKWIGISGHNIPSFELFMSPDWRGTQGHYYADQPSFRSGNYVQGVKLTFKKGKAVRVEAQTGQKFVQKQLVMDQGASRLGEFSLTDKRFSRINRFMANTLYDENYGGRFGNCHVALGSSYADTYDGNTARLTKTRKAQLGFNDSALHWDLVNTEKKRVVAHLTGGERITIYENGVFNYA